MEENTTTFAAALLVAVVLVELFPMNSVSLYHPPEVCSSYTVVGRLLNQHPTISVLCGARCCVRFETPRSVTSCTFYPDRAFEVIVIIV